MYGLSMGADQQSNKRPRRGGGRRVSWENLPEEIWQTIFLKLPVESLLRCKCVRKSWSESLSSSDFVNRHLAVASRAAHGIDNPDIVFVGSYHEEYEKDWQYLGLYKNFGDDNENVRLFSLPSYVKSYKLVGSCNGLMCLVFNGNREIVFVCNPCTKESTQLGYYRGGCTNTYYGFGHDAVHDSYKVVVISEYRGEVIGKVWVLGTRSWRTLGDVPFKPCSRSSMNGVRYWLSEQIGGAKSESMGIGSFHFEKEEFHFAPLPSHVSANSRGLELGVFGDCMSVTTVTKASAHGRVVIWATDDYKHGVWTRRHEIDMPTDEFAMQFVMLSDWDVLVNYKDKLDSYYLGLPWAEEICDAAVHVQTLVSPVRGRAIRSERFTTVMQRRVLH